ncbi:MAG: methyltransferase domain-containing protein [Candidatus Rokuibacteriota bacterium]
MTPSRHDRDVGAYPLERTAEEMARLRMQAAALEADARILIELIGVGTGWRCLDLACGVGGITDVLSRSVGPTGRVVGLDYDADKLTAARQWAQTKGLANAEFVEGDAYRTGLAAASFDLVHVRFVFTTVGRDEELLREALRLVRPGGALAVQEADVITLSCHPPHPAWDRLKHAITTAMTRLGGDTHAGRRMFGLLRGAGLQDVRFRPLLRGFTHSDPMADFLPSTAASMRSAIIEAGLLREDELDAALEVCRRHLADPATISTSVLVYQAWGRKLR